MGLFHTFKTFNYSAFHYREEVFELKLWCISFQVWLTTLCILIQPGVKFTRAWFNTGEGLKNSKIHRTISITYLHYFAGKRIHSRDRACSTAAGGWSPSLSPSLLSFFHLWLSTLEVSSHKKWYKLELQTKVHTKVHNHGEGLVGAFSWLRVPTSAFTFKTLCSTSVKTRWNWDAGTNIITDGRFG